MKADRDCASAARAARFRTSLPRDGDSMHRLSLARRLGVGALALAALVGFAWWLTTGRSSGRGEELSRAVARPGMRQMRGVVEGGGVDEWTLRFAGGRQAEVEIRGDGAGRLHCVLRDAARNRVDSAGEMEGGCRLRLVPVRTARYGVIVRNPSGIAQGYVVVVR
jgi:hypothetical protein